MELPNGRPPGSRRAPFTWNMPEDWKKRLAFTVLLSAIVSVVLSVYLLIPGERTDLGPGDTYGIVGFAGMQLLLHGTGRTFPEIRRIDPEDGAVLRIAGLTSSRRKYAVLLCQKGVGIYRLGERISGYRGGDGMRIVSSFIADYDGDGNDDIFLLLGKEGEAYGERLVVLGFDGGGVKKIYDASFQKVNPWKVQVCDVDGDGKKEVSLGVYTVAKYHPVYAKRPFLYEFRNRKLYPKWLGSRLSQPFDDYVFSDMDGDGMDELISVETMRDGKKEFDAYKWTGFGFESIGVSRAYDTIRDVVADGGSITAVCGDPAAAESKTFVYHDGKIEAGG